MPKSGKDKDCGYYIECEENYKDSEECIKKIFDKHIQKIIKKRKKEKKIIRGNYFGDYDSYKWAGIREGYFFRYIEE